MKLSSLVVLVLLVQTCTESLAVILHFLSPDTTTAFSSSQSDQDRAELYEDTSWLTNTTRVLRDYSETLRGLPQVYLVPHLWSGVLARMVSGYRCVVADQEVDQIITRWTDTVSQHQHQQGEEENHIIFALARLNSQDPNPLMALEQQIERALSQRRAACVRPPGRLELTELVFILANISSCLLTIAVTLLANNKQMGFFYLPWMILTGYEISGNICVTVAFLASPGLPTVICAVCLAKLFLLRWMFVKVVRKQMIQLMDRDDTEKNAIRSKLSIKGKVRLSRFLGTYK